MKEGQPFGQALEAWPHQTYNWGRWSNGRGTLNLVDRAATARGVQTVRDRIRHCDPLIDGSDSVN